MGIPSHPTMALPHGDRNYRCMTTQQKFRAGVGGGAMIRLTDLIRTARFGAGLFCPRCGHRRIQRWGSFQCRSGRRHRYRCAGCGRTFSDFTGSPLAYLKLPDVWRDFCDIALGTATIRRAARMLCIHTSTAFRWRHRLLDRLLATERVVLGGEVSLDLAWLPFSAKGARQLERAPRRRVFDGFSFETTVDWIVVACAEDGSSFARRLGTETPTSSRIQEVLGSRLDQRARLVAPRNRRIPFAPVAAALGIPLDVGPSHAVWRREPRGAEPGRLYMVRVRHWLRRFRGVASRYLDGYLVWFRALAASCPEGGRPEVEVAASPLGIFP